MGNYSGFRVLAKVIPEVFLIAKQVLESERDETVEHKSFLGLCQEMRHGTNYFTFKVDNHGVYFRDEDRSEYEVKNDIRGRLSNKDPLANENVIDAFFSSKHTSNCEEWAQALCVFLDIEENVIVPYLMSQYEESRDWGDRDGYAWLYLARRQGDAVSCLKTQIRIHDINETSFVDKEVLNAVAAASKIDEPIPPELHPFLP